VRNKAAHPYKTHEITVPCILIFMFLNSEKEDKIFCNGCNLFQNVMFLISLWMQFWTVTVILKFSNCYIQIFEYGHKLSDNSQHFSLRLQGSTHCSSNLAMNLELMHFSSM
jgi:hypothetical protein